MKKSLLLLGMLLATLSNLHANEENEPLIDDSIKPFESCAPASEHAQQVLDYLVELFEYQGDPVTLCRSTTTPSLMSWSKLVGMEQHPYVSWKKKPVTKPYINYNPHYMEQLELAQGELIVYALMARQLGHHIKQHTDYQTPLVGLAPPLSQVAEADYFAGYFLAKQQISPEYLTRIQQSIFGLSESPDATTLEQRQRLLIEGWTKGGGEAFTLTKPKVSLLW